MQTIWLAGFIYFTYPLLITTRYIHQHTMKPTLLNIAL